MALLHTGDLDFAPELPKFKGLELFSMPNIDLAADLSICIPVPRTAGFGCHLESNTCCSTQHSTAAFITMAEQQMLAGTAQPRVPTLSLESLHCRYGGFSRPECATPPGGCVWDCGGHKHLHRAASSVSPPVLPVRELKALSSEFKFKCMTSAHE